MTIAYNTLFEIKRQLGGTALPPYTPLTPEAATVINPEYVAGMGAIKADPELGLQCPICGQWCQNSLGVHVGMKHKDIGGVVGLKTLLGYSQNTALQTIESHKRQHDAGIRRYVEKGLAPGFEKGTVVARDIYLARRSRSEYTHRKGHGLQNLTRSCQVQMIEHFHKLARKLGRQPGVRDWQREKLPWSVGPYAPVYKSWNQLVIAAGGIPKKRGTGYGSLKRDFCKRGHSLQDESNIVHFRYSNGKAGRRCRSCANLNSRLSYTRKTTQRASTTS